MRATDPATGKLVRFATPVFMAQGHRVVFVRSRNMLFCITRNLMPSNSSAFVTGRLLLVRLRKPFSQ